MAENSASLEDFLPKNSGKSSYKHLQKATKIEVARSLSDGLVKGVGEIIRMEKPADEKKAIKKRRQENKEGIASLNLMWLDTMINSEAQLREKMSFSGTATLPQGLLTVIFNKNSFISLEKMHWEILANCLGL